MSWEDFYVRSGSWPVTESERNCSPLVSELAVLSPQCSQQTAIWSYYLSCRGRFMYDVLYAHQGIFFLCMWIGGKWIKSQNSKMSSGEAGQETGNMKLIEVDVMFTFLLLELGEMRKCVFLNTRLTLSCFQEYQNFGWWVGEKKGNIGIVPKDYLMELYVL